MCEHSVGPSDVTCDFKSGKVILQQAVAREQMTKLLQSGATDLLEGFVSNKTRRKFKARLAWDAKEGKVVFAFEPRPERPGKGGAGGAAKKVAGAVTTTAAPAGKAVAKTAIKKAPAKKAAAKKVPAKKAAARTTAAKPPVQD